MRINIDQFHFELSINRIVRYFIAADLTVLAGWGLADPILAIFVVDKIPGATLLTIGVMAAIYWIVKSIIQIPISLFLDRTDGEKDDFYAVVVGLLVASVTMFSFMAATSVTHLYIIQFIKALAFGLYVPAWAAIVSRHLDKDKVAFEWALSSTSVGLSIGVAGLAGSWVAKYSFDLVFLLGGFLCLISALILLLVPDLILPQKKGEISESVMKDHRPVSIQK
ncbi:MAG: MFS transporter [bacterium]|nr:MFS transporter [bacterium]